MNAPNADIKKHIGGWFRPGELMNPQLNLCAVPNVITPGEKALKIFFK